MSTHYPNTYDADLSRLAIQYLMDEQGISKKRMADMLAQSQKFSSNPSSAVSTFLEKGTGLSTEKVFQVATLLGAGSWSELYSKGEQAAKENPFNPKWVQDSFKILMKEQKLTTTQLADQTNRQQAHLEKFLSTGEYVSIGYLLEYAKGLGATGWGDLYQKAEVPGRLVQQSDHDLAVSGIVESLQDLPVSGKVSDVMNKPIKHVLEERAHQGQLHDQEKNPQR